MFRFQQKIMKHVKKKKNVCSTHRKINQNCLCRSIDIGFTRKILYCLIVKEVKGTMGKTKGHYANNAQEIQISIMIETIKKEPNKNSGVEKYKRYKMVVQYVPLQTQ